MGGSVDSSPEFAREWLEEIKLQLEGVFAGGDPDVEAAEKLLRERNLTMDTDLRNLIEMRRHSNNPLKSISVKVVFVEVASHMIRCLASAGMDAVYKIAPVSLEMREERDEQLKQLRRQKLRLRVEF